MIIIILVKRNLKKLYGEVFGKGNNTIQKTSIAQNMNKWFRGTKKKRENSPYNYSALATHIAINYLISKFEDMLKYHDKFITEFLEIMLVSKTELVIL